MTVLGTLPPQPKKKDDKSVKTDIRLIKATIGSGHDILQGHPEKAVSRAIATGIKLAFSDREPSPFQNPNISPIALLKELKKLGINALAWEPETLMVAIDRRYHGWTDERATQAIDHFHLTGLIDTDVDVRVRQKIYAIRVISTSDSAHTEWHIFEKVGSAFNDRIPQFGLVEPMTAAECAYTVSAIEAIRPDDYSNEIKIYIAACCQQDGLLTVVPIKSLAMAQSYLEQMNNQETEEPLSAELKTAISAKYSEFMANHIRIQRAPEDLVGVQAMKLFAIEKMVEDLMVSS